MKATTVDRPAATESTLKGVLAMFLTRNMIWQQNVDKIIMLTKITESDSVRLS